MKKKENLSEETKQEGLPNLNPAGCFDWPVTVPAVTGQNTSPVTDLTIFI